MRLPWHEVQNLDLLSGTRLKAGEPACPTGDLFAAVFEQGPNVDEPTTASLLGEQFADGDQFINFSPSFACDLDSLVDRDPTAVAQRNGLPTRAASLRFGSSVRGWHRDGGCSRVLRRARWSDAATSAVR